MNFSALLYVGIGGAIGSILRYISAKTIDERIQSLFPYGTLTVNIAGSLVLGFLYGLALRKGGLDENTRLFIGTGICGGFTTFSTFALENFFLIHQKPGFSALYLLLSLIFGLLAVAGGYFLGRSLVS